MLGRIDDVEAAGEHRDRAGAEARLVSGRVDAARKARDDGEPGRAELGGKHARELDAGGGGLPRADDRRSRAAPEALRCP